MEIWINSIKMLHSYTVLFVTFPPLSLFFCFIIIYGGFIIKHFFSLFRYFETQWKSIDFSGDPDLQPYRNVFNLDRKDGWCGDQMFRSLQVCLH